ncbi:RpiB/LacA/LacB family sugar-phosphate isomerase [Patescibacteria group bacterium]|nr:RpiB/LacA/LacB family sugar-phosphate isomerase [Patescibacteria group bacterium]
MKIYLASDHAGFELKEKIKEFLIKKNVDVEDCGAFVLDKDDDYPDFISLAAKKVAENVDSLGIVFGGSGQAEMMVANKFKGIRCALFYSTAIAIKAVDITGRLSTDPYEIIRLTREHNNANMLSIGARFLTDNDAIKVVDFWLKTPFKGDERHVRRIEKIREIENKQN